MIIERLNEALEECKLEKAIAEEVNFEEEIRKDLAIAEAEIRAKYDARKAEGVRDCEYQIRALEKLIAKEVAKSAETVACDTANAEETGATSEFCRAVY